MKTWTIRKEGLFTGIPVGVNHCGTGDNFFKYNAWVTSTKLDPQGFVVDNALIHQAAQTSGTIDLSCEQYAEALAYAIYESIVPELRPFVTEIRTLICTSLPNGDATCTWLNPYADVQAGRTCSFEEIEKSIPIRTLGPLAHAA